MSKESATDLIQKLKTDPAFAAQVLAIADPAQRLAFLAAEGYAVSLGQVDAYNQELGDAALDAVAGGANIPVLAAIFKCTP